MIGTALAQAYIDDPRHELGNIPGARAVMDDHFQRAHDNAVALARDCFFNMIADAARFDEDVDGDEVNGHTVITVDYHLTVGHSQLEELAEALGIKRGWCENIGDAIRRAIDEESAQGIEAAEADETGTGSAVGESPVA